MLLHAFPLSADQWLPQLHRVPPGWRFIAPDLRGFRGMGPAFEDSGAASLTMDDYAADVLALMTQLEIERAFVTGLSMGGYVAFAMLRQAPARIGGLVLSNTRAGADSEQARAGRAASLELLEKEGVAGLARAMTPKLLGERTRRDHADLEEAVRRLIVMNSREAIATALVALRDRPDSSSLLPSITVPTLVITGDEDAIMPLADVEALATAIPRARLAVMPGAGHLSNLETSLLWNSALDTFLSGV